MSVATAFTIKLSDTFRRIGTQNGLAVPTPNAQDPANDVLHELLVAKALASMAAKRYDNAKLATKTFIKEADMRALADTATKTRMKTSEVLLRSADYGLTVSCASPVQRVDHQALVNSLIKSGVDMVTINKAVKEATSFNAPATSYDVHPRGDE